eukprot:6176529-Pleurochrysis_carterae.AAC.9
MTYITRAQQRAGISVVEYVAYLKRCFAEWRARARLVCEQQQLPDLIDVAVDAPVEDERDRKLLNLTNTGKRRKERGAGSWDQGRQRAETRWVETSEVA